MGNDVDVNDVRSRNSMSRLSNYSDIIEGENPGISNFVSERFCEKRKDNGSDDYSLSCSKNSNLPIDEVTESDRSETSRKHRKSKKRKSKDKDSKTMKHKKKKLRSETELQDEYIDDSVHRKHSHKKSKKEKKGKKG